MAHLNDRFRDILPKSQPASVLGTLDRMEGGAVELSFQTSKSNLALLLKINFAMPPTEMRDAVELYMQTMSG